MCHNFHSIPTLCVKRAKNASRSFVLFSEQIAWSKIHRNGSASTNHHCPFIRVALPNEKGWGNKSYNSLLLLATFSHMQMHWALSLLRYWLGSKSDLSVSQKLGVFKPVYKKCIITLWVIWLHFKVCLAKVLVSKGKAINGRRHDNSRETISCSSEMRQRCRLPSTCSCLACLRLGLPQVDAAHAKINSFR